MTTKPLTAPLAQIALANTRPSPPSSRPMRIVPPTALEPDRSLIDKPGAAEVAGKKKKRVRTPETIAKFKATLATKKAAAGEPIGRPKLDGLDLILDIIELCERAKKGLTRSQRARLRTALNERLS